jgi:hypothetical protein
MIRNPARDYLIIVAAFATILLSGYGTGRLVGYRSGLEAARQAPAPPEWRNDALAGLDARLHLRPEQLPPVEQALDATALEIQRTHDATLLAYLRLLDDLYQKLDGLLDEPQAATLRREQESLAEEIAEMLDYQQRNNPPAKP